MTHEHDGEDGAQSGADSARAREIFKIRGMDCAEEIAVLRSEIGPLVGGEQNLAFDVLKGRMLILETAPRVAMSAIVEAVARTGMKAEPWRDGKLEERPSWFARHGRNAAAAASGLATLLGFAVHAIAVGDPRAAIGSEGLGLAAGPPLAARVAYGLAIGAALALVSPKAWFAVRRLRPDMNLLMTIAVGGALFIGEWLEAATVSFLFAVSLALEAWSVGRARRAVEALMSLEPPLARVQRDGRELDVPPGEVTIGECIVVRPGERIALDGRVVEGTSHVNQAPITGESVPVTKEPGSGVFAGTVNGDGALVVEVTHDAGDTTLARIVRMVSEAQARRGPSEQWVERFAAYYTPAVLGLATLLAVVPPLLGAPFDVWLYRALILLVIGCPCSLVISTPVTIVAAIAAAARHGVLLKGGTYVEVPARLRAIALDKTGTLTEGRPRVVRVDAMSGHDDCELLEIAHALEQRSDHPLATAIVEHAEQLGVHAKPAADFEIIQGKGASGTIDGERYWLGSHRFLEERGQETPEVHAQLEALVGEGRSVVVLGNDTHVCGFFALADAIRLRARESVAALRSAGVAHVVMLTGDNRGTAERVAEETGVDEVRAELLPADKVTAIEALVSEHGQVAMVGDGVNDAPALARATLGIAMGSAGTDVALETADVALMSDDLSKIAWLIGHSRRAVAVIRQNIVFSLGVKALFVGLALAGISSLWMAIAADMGASLLVTFNGLRLLRDRRVAGAGPRD